MPRGWRAPLLAAVALLVAGVSVGGWLLLRDRRSSPVPATAPSSAPVAPLSSARATALSDWLTSGDGTRLRSALVLPSGQALDPAATGQLASLGAIRFNLATFTFLDERSAEVRGTVATPPAGTSADWTFTLLYLGEDWMLVDGVPAG